MTAAMHFFSKACSYMEQAGLSDEVVWQREADFTEFTESDLLREHAWVALCSGFRESAVRRVFDYVSLCFCDWESAEAIVSAGEICCTTAALAFANRIKLQGIFSTAKHINNVGFHEFKQSVQPDPINRLQALPFIGPVTSWHLAKNLGLDVAKPDRHLVRVSERLGFRSADDLCRELAATTGEQAKVVDLIVWRYIADNPQQLQDSFA
ncbi:hypothetical protein ACDA63_18820 [Uliginosibacterium sp. sgz301328]|uniref:hypothetical protein n=1 Tax=Uliginosibacterium sp. sgz301328 TaxID=3243764 RepID=UPI00359E630C